MLRSVAASSLAILAATVPAHASEIWVAPTHQQDVGGLGVGSHGIWPVTPAGVVRLTWAVPGDLASFGSARLVLVPQAAAATATLTLYVCRAAGRELVDASCAGPLTQPFSSVANQLLEIDITPAIAGRIGAAGQSHLAVIAFTSSAATDRVLGLRFAYEPAFAGDGARLTNINASRLGGLDSTAFARSIHTHDISQVSNAASLGANAFAGTQTITAGHVNVDSTDTILGKGGSRLLHGRTTNLFLGSGGNDTYTGGNNIGIGSSALAGLAQGNFNLAIGNDALRAVTIGFSNTAIGAETLQNTQTGAGNTAVGRRAIGFAAAGHANTAIGNDALFVATGNNNTAIGFEALASNVGDQNVAVGFEAGEFSTGSDNIYLGARVRGVAGESFTMYLGRVGSQQRTFLAGTRGVTTGVNNAIPVVIDSNGQLGTVSSSRRYKEDVHDMADASRRLLDLRPVTFRYAKPFADGAKPVQFGLIAEEVATAFPELVVRDDEGRPETVQYQHLSVLLLNELQRLQKRVADLERLAARRQP